uniref:S1 motif domain-containing protein n=1 Tax=Callorhinchus milii TaxID=7868 RepID=A0A4W3ITG1_CALMI
MVWCKRALTRDCCVCVCRKDRRVENRAVQQFIARKADLLFAQSWRSAPVTEVNDDEAEEYYAIMPPMEQFMEIPDDEKRQYFFRDIERGDVVIGRITSIRDFGFFIKLICLGGGLSRDIEALEITALCPVRDVPSHGKHEDPLSYYQVGDLLRAALKDVDRYHEKLAVTLYPSALPTRLSHLKLGVISSEDLPSYYRRNSTLGSPSAETYDKVLHRTLGFANPSTVDFLLGKLGISEVESPSLMRGLQSKNFTGDDYAAALRKKQSASWALKCVKAGVDHFKAGRHVEAMNEYNKALEIDSNNVEALVARGALYATKGSLSKAISDFDLALDACPTHRNARKYLCQTLVERGGQLEEEEKLVSAENCYKRALILDKTFHEAEAALQRLRKFMQKSLEQKDKETRKDTKKTEASSAEKLRKLLKEEKRMKKKRKRSTSSSSSSANCSSTDPSSADSSSSESSLLVSSSASEHSRKHKSAKKRQRSRSESSHSQKSRVGRRSGEGSAQLPHGSKEWYPPPADTSASFLNQKQEVAKLLERNECSEDQWSEIMEKQRSRSLSSSSSSVEILDLHGGRSEDNRGSFNNSRTEANSSDKWYKADIGWMACDKKSNNHDRWRREVQDPRMSKEFNNKRYERSNRSYSISSAESDHSHLAAVGQHVRENSCSYKSNSKEEMCGQRSMEGGDGRKGYGYGSDEGDKDSRGESVGSKQWREGQRAIEKEVRGSSDVTAEQPDKNMPQNLLEIFNQIAEFEKGKGQGGKCKQKYK